MVPISNVFGERAPDISDNGYQHIVSDGNTARRALITFTGTDLGSFNNMFDLDDTSHFGTLTTTADGTEFYVTLDFLQQQTNAVISCYFSSATASGGITVTTVFQRSEDGTSYTDMASAVQSGVGETWKNHGEQPAKFRYLRIKMTATGGGSGHTNGGRIYFLQVAKG